MGFLEPTQARYVFRIEAMGRIHGLVWSQHRTQSGPDYRQLGGALCKLHVDIRLLGPMQSRGHVRSNWTGIVQNRRPIHHQLLGFLGEG